MNKSDYVINGELFLKTRPDIQDTDEFIEVLKKDVLEIEDEIKKNGDDGVLSSLLEEDKSIIKSFEDLSGKKDYSHMCNFYQLFVRDNAFQLKEIMENQDLYCYLLSISPNMLDYQNISDLKRDFMSLRDYLEKAKSIGKLFYRTKPINEYNPAYTREFSDLIDLKTVVLYAYEDLFLCKDVIGTYPGRYRIINPAYLSDGNYELVGDSINDYSNSSQVYKRILNQCLSDQGKRRVL